jgi:molybdopterin-binding protein
MQLSARNQIKGKIVKISEGSVNTEVEVEIADGQVIVSIITKSSANKMDLQIGDEVSAVVKASSVMIAK